MDDTLISGSLGPRKFFGANQAYTYALDGLGNWKTSNFTLVGSGGSTSTTAEVRQHNYVNEITSVRDTITSDTPTTTAFSYDKKGNLLNDGVLTYQYDVYGRLIQIGNASSSSVIATYLYDAMGRRVMKTIIGTGDTGFGGITGDIPAGGTVYYYDGQQVIEQRNFATYTEWEQIYFWGQYIDELMFFAVPTATVYRVLSDLLYRSVAIVTTANVVTEAYDTDAYGNTLCYSGPGTDGLWFTDDDVPTNNPINSTIFTGRQYDSESQIYYYRARYYNPVIGRFISRDPIEEEGGINLYLYVTGNPVNALDPLGFQSEDISLPDPAPPKVRLNSTTHIVEKCNVEIWLGHGDTIPDIYKCNKCSAVASIGCAACFTKSTNRPIPGTSLPPGLKIYWEDAKKLALHDFDLGVATAKAICKSTAHCCKEVKVSILCKFGNHSDSADAVDYFSDICGKTNTIQC